MALSYKTRRRLALLVLAVGLPAYVAAAWWVVGLFARPPVWLELAIYIALGVAWAVPLRSVFIGVGQADPDAGAPGTAPDGAGERRG